MDKSDTADSKYRVSLQAALRLTLKDKISTTAGQFAARAKIGDSTLSEFMNSRRSINLSTFEALVFALDREQYDYFLSVLFKGNAMLRGADVSFEKDTEEQRSVRDAFFALVASYCYRCSQAEQLDLLAVIYEASLQNPTLALDQQDES